MGAWVVVTELVCGGSSSTQAAAVHRDPAALHPCPCPSPLPRPPAAAAAAASPAQGGVRDLDLQAGHITDNGDGILFQGAAGRAAAIFNTTVSHVSVMQSNQQTVAFSSPAPGATFAGVTVRINFLLTGPPAAQRSAACTAWATGRSVRRHPGEHGACV